MAAIRLHPDDVAGRLDAVNAHLEGRAPVYAGEYRVRGGDGEYRWVRVRGLCVRDAQGKPVRIAGSVTDIDSRRRAEDALRLSQERLALAMTGSNGGHWVWDTRTDALFVADTLNQLFGLPTDLQPSTRREYFGQICVYPADKDKVQQIAVDVLNGSATRFDIEYRIVLPDGALRWILTRAQAFHDEAGQPSRVAGVSVDISARKRTEEALRDSEQCFALAVAGSNDGILDWDIAGDRMFASARAWQLIGLPPEQRLLTRAQWAERVMPRFHPDDVPYVKADFGDRLDHPPESHENECRMLAADGEYHWTRFRGRLVRDAAGVPIRWAGSVSDIDALKTAEQALRSSEERYELAVEGSNAGMWDWHISNDTLFVSARAQQIFGLMPGEPLRARSEWAFAFEYHPDDAAAAEQSMNDYLAGSSGHWEVEARLRHAGGQWRWYRDRGVALRDARGKAYRMAGSIEGVTDRMNAEAAREQLETQLRQAQKLESIGTLAGGIAHDFNNILAAILGYGEMAQKIADEGSALRRYIDAAISAGLRAKSLVERILAFSRSGVGDRVPVHVQSVVAEALDAVAASLPGGIRLERRLDAGDSAVLSDPTQVHQVVMNLCANAVQAMKRGGAMRVVLEHASFESPRCATTMLPGSSYVGGGIDVESTVGEGSTFTVYLPWKSWVAPPDIVEQHVPPGNGEVVLLVDDEEALVRLGEVMIAGLGYEPIGFTSGGAALRSFHEAPGRFDLVLSDEAMPEMTGCELARSIRAVRADIPIVLMSGYVTSALTQRARDSGIVDVLAKPLVARDIARSLAEVLQRNA